MIVIVYWIWNKIGFKAVEMEYLDQIILKVKNEELEWKLLSFLEKLSERIIIAWQFSLNTQIRDLSVNNSLYLGVFCMKH